MDVCGASLRKKATRCARIAMARQTSAPEEVDGIDATLGALQAELEDFIEKCEALQADVQEGHGGTINDLG